MENVILDKLGNAFNFWLTEFELIAVPSQFNVAANIESLERYCPTRLEITVDLQQFIPIIFFINL